MSTRQRENRKNGNQESSSKEASEEGSQENSKEEVSKQRNRQHNRGTPKASPDVFLSNAVSPVFMRLRQPFAVRFQVSGFPVVPGKDAFFSPQPRVTAGSERTDLGSLALPISEGKKRIATRISCTRLQRSSRLRLSVRKAAWSSPTPTSSTGNPGGRTWKRICLPKWYWAMPPFEETVAP